MNICWNLGGIEVERESFRVIELECDLHKRMPTLEWCVAHRLIHTTVDMSTADMLVFRCDAIGSGLCALWVGVPIFCDSKMIRAGLSIEWLKRLNPGYGPESLHCHINDQDVTDRAKLEGHIRVLCSAEKAWSMFDGAIVLIGNTPLALAHIAQYALEGGVRSAFVAGMPVGSVNVVEPKELPTQCDVPQIAPEGRCGGNALAVTTLHAVMESA